MELSNEVVAFVAVILISVSVLFASFAFLLLGVVLFLIILKSRRTATTPALSQLSMSIVVEESLTEGLSVDPSASELLAPNDYQQYSRTASANTTCASGYTSTGYNSGYSMSYASSAR
ncbi:hypothetical protein J8273_8226 [Carpediemonas membranifera]|uniref:Uncharacterized protein n=1 Tax=Carpediemonas membranifera TaxID=201153 RepID=A0A8J6BUB8_9EUKA|nr:hypothetical protein J8273_8226 [Carpediemonas membranifera]|eukprot:KAG9390186.1 hypothetical protein J8273_8226 [Carpediemonas membranifera]